MATKRSWYRTLTYNPPKPPGVEKPRPWYQWFEDSDTPEERRLLWKLDFLLVGYTVVMYYVKNLDQSNVNNSYVSGMSTQLHMGGNNLVELQTMYIVGAAVFQLPFMYLFTVIPMNILIPTLDILWGIFTLIQYKATSYGQMMAYRFIIGALEAFLGSWYRKDEIGRRGGVFYLGLALGNLTAGLLQASILKHMDGKLGIEAWAWNFLIAGFWITKEERALAKRRLERTGGAVGSRNPLTLPKLKKVLKGWKIYVLTLWSTLFWNCGPNTAAYLLWLKSLYGSSSSALVHANNVSTTAPAVGFFLVLAVNFAGDFFRSKWGAMTVGDTFLLIANIILASGTQNVGARFWAFNTAPFSYAQSSTLYGWSNIILRRDNEERAIVLIIMNTIAQASTAFIGLLTYPTSESPRYLKGYTFSAVDTFCLIAFTQVVRYLSNRDEIKFAEEAEASEKSSIDDKSELSVEDERQSRPKELSA
ncbi:hypothetical protein MNV49_005188 [Pseudohyphozyma bogoriensis]|nr:hypothetical protein MNV49_005188 [Pseudohyphozyma bogoriensis]